MIDYTKIDAAICKEIAAGNSVAKYIVSEIDTLTRPLWGYDELCAQSGFRVVDRRLQALKKAGKISFARSTGWVMGGAK